MSKRISDIPPFKGRTYRDFILHFPSWMGLGGPLGGFLLTAAKEMFLVGTKHTGDYLNSFLPTADASISELLYTIEANADFSTTDVLSGEYTTPVSGTVGLTRVLSEDTLFGCTPTRVAHAASHTISGEALTPLPASGEALSYVQITPASGVYYFSMVEDPSLYILSDAYEIIASGELSMRYVEEDLVFFPVTGSWYRAALSHVPDGALEVFDVYAPGVYLTNLDVSGTYVEIAEEDLGNLGRLRGRYAYKDFDTLHRITTDALCWNITQERMDPAMLIGHDEQHFENISTKLAHSYVSNSVLLSADCRDIKPGERASVDFTYEFYVHQEEALSGIYQYDIGGTAHENSLRIFSESGTHGSVLYYHPGTENLYTSPVDDTVAVRALSPDEYYMEAGGGKVTVYNDITAVLGAFHITYYVKNTRTYNVFAQQSYRRSSGDIYNTPFWDDYDLDSDGVLRPKSILKLTEGDADLWTMLSSAPLEQFSVSVPRARKGIVFDPEPGNLWILQDNDILYNLDRAVRYDVQPRDATYTHAIDDVAHDGWIPSGSFWYKRVPLIDFEQPDVPYLLRSMAIYDAFLGILAEKDGQYYIQFVSRFDPEETSIFSIIGGDAI